MPNTKNLKRKRICPIDTVHSVEEKPISKKMDVNIGINMKMNLFVKTVTIKRKEVIDYMALYHG